MLRGLLLASFPRLSFTLLLPATPHTKPVQLNPSKRSAVEKTTTQLLRMQQEDFLEALGPQLGPQGPSTHYEEKSQHYCMKFEYIQ